MSERQSLYTPSLESRSVKIEKRGDGQQVIVGYAAVFYRAGDDGTVYKPWVDLHERVMPGAFDRALRENQDVRGLFNHEKSAILGRTKSGTMRLSVDAVGLKYEIDVADTTIGRDTATILDRGDVDGSSFSFQPQKAVWREEGDVLIRELEDVDLFDVGPVTFPAYQSTTAGTRSAGLKVELVTEATRSLRQISSSEVDVEYRFRELQQQRSQNRC